MTPGPNPKLTIDEAVEIMENSDRPFWSEKQFAKQSDVSKPTARKRLREGVKKGVIGKGEVANASVYYLPGKEMQRIGVGKDPIKSDLQGYWNDYFVGDWTKPSVVTTLHDIELTTGNQAKFLVAGRPGNWDYYEVVPFDEEIGWIEPSGGEWYTAIIVGELFDKPTVPIEHLEYPDDYDLELNIGGEYIENGNLIAAGLKNHLIKPCNDALFLRDVTVEKLEGPGPSMNDAETVYAPYPREKNMATLLRERGNRQNISEDQE